MADERSKTARYLERLRRQASSARLLVRPRASHILTGGIAGLVIQMLWSIPFSTGTPDVAPIALALIPLGGSTLFGVGGWWLWNRLAAGNLDQLLALARGNLLDAGLLLLCMESELPAEYEPLRRVSQSYGKTRAKNWDELRPGSMQEHVKWLVENYRVICTALRLPHSTPALARLRRLVLWVTLAPTGLLLGSLVVLAIRVGPNGAPAHGTMIAILKALGVAVALCFCGGGVGALLRQLEQAALLKVLTDEIEAGGSMAGPAKPRG